MSSEFDSDEIPVNVKSENKNENNSNESSVELKKFMKK